MSDSKTDKKPRRKSTKKPGIDFLIQTPTDILHITAPQNSEIELHSIKENPDLIKFGQIGGIVKIYALKGQKDVFFVRMGRDFYCFNKFKIRELESSIKKAGWYIGAYGKRTKKYD